MHLIFSILKKTLPELNREIITPARMIYVFYHRLIEFHELDMPDAGAFVTCDGKNYVFLKMALQQLIYHETILHEGCHALVHHPAPFLMWRHQIEAEVFSLVGMMPITNLRRLNKIRHQLEPESYELLMRRNKVNERWRL